MSFFSSILPKRIVTLNSASDVPLRLSAFDSFSMNPFKADDTERCSMVWISFDQPTVKVLEFLSSADRKSNNHRRVFPHSLSHTQQVRWARVQKVEWLCGASFLSLNVELGRRRASDVVPKRLVLVLFAHVRSDWLVARIKFRSPSFPIFYLFRESRINCFWSNSWDSP